MMKKGIGMKNKFAFTMVELVVAISILAMLGTFVALLFSNDRKGVQLSNQDLMINLAATEILDQILSMPASAFEEGAYSEEDLRENKPCRKSGMKLLITKYDKLSRKLDLVKIEENNSESLLISLSVSSISPLNKKVLRTRKFCTISSFDINRGGK